MRSLPPPDDLVPLSVRASSYAATIRLSCLDSWSVSLSMSAKADEMHADAIYTSKPAYSIVYRHHERTPT